MKHNESTIFIFIASVIVGILISSTFSFDRKTTRVFLNAKQYQDAYNQKNKLQSEVSDLNQKYAELYGKIIQYREAGESSTEATRQINEELVKNQILLGSTDVQGQGIEIELNDYGEGSNYINRSEDVGHDTTIHDFDMYNIINELKLAGAEAISVNDVRIIDKSEIYCASEYFLINRIKLYAPFRVVAIGNKEKLYSYMTRDRSYLNTLELRGRGIITVSMTQSDNVKISAFSGNLKYNYVKEAEKK
ncbi:MAG: DUF881 domain-containing protein [Bacillota bacterium]|nr:DUF881 domain-containing protein [Bacillota bacterium]